MGNQTLTLQDAKIAEYLCHVTFFLLAGRAILWKSTKQSLVASSTIIAKFVACYEASKQAIWLRNFIYKLYMVDEIERPLIIS